MEMATTAEETRRHTQWARGEPMLQQVRAQIYERASDGHFFMVISGGCNPYVFDALESDGYRVLNVYSDNSYTGKRVISWGTDKELAQNGLKVLPTSFVELPPWLTNQS